MDTNINVCPTLCYNIVSGFFIPIKIPITFYFVSVDVFLFVLVFISSSKLQNILVIFFVHKKTKLTAIRLEK